MIVVVLYHSISRDIHSVHWNFPEDHGFFRFFGRTPKLTNWACHSRLVGASPLTVVLWTGYFQGKAGLGYGFSARPCSTG